MDVYAVAADCNAKPNQCVRQYGRYDYGWTIGRSIDCICWPRQSGVFILSLILFGVGSGCNVFVAQFWGKQDRQSIRKTMALSILLCMIPCVIFTALAIFTPAFLMRIFSNDPQVIELGCQYLRIIAISYIPFGISITLSGSIRTVERPFCRSLYLLCRSLLIRRSTTYLFLVKFGSPALGVVGAALATTITRLLELIIVTTALYTRFRFISIRPKDFGRSLHVAFIKPFMRAVTPVILNESTWGIGVAMYSVVFFAHGYGCRCRYEYQ